MRLRPLWLLILVSIPLASQQNSSLPGNETLVYNIDWRLFNAGKARVQWQPQRGGYQVNLHVESTGFVSRLFKVDDDYSAILNSAACTESVHLTTHEGSRERETRITFDGNSHRASYLERDLIRNSVMAQHESEIPPCVHDVVSGLFFMRTLNLEPGQSTTVPVSDGKKTVMAKVEAQAREDLKTPEGTSHTIRYEVYLFNNVLFRRSAHLNVWMTDDRRKLPVQIRVRMTFTVGTITLQLEKQE